MAADFCHFCDKELITGYGHHQYRENLRFCDDKCRTRYHNAQKKVKRNLKSILAMIADIEGLLPKQASLGQEALDAIRQIANVSSETKLDCVCGNCGQTVWLIPQKGEKCDFCQAEHWIFKPKRKNPPKEEN